VHAEGAKPWRWQDGITHKSSTRHGVASKSATSACVHWHTVASNSHSCQHSEVAQSFMSMKPRGPCDQPTRKYTVDCTPQHSCEAGRGHLRGKRSTGQQGARYRQHRDAGSMRCGRQTSKEELSRSSSQPCAGESSRAGTANVFWKRALVGNIIIGHMHMHATCATTPATTAQPSPATEATNTIHQHALLHVSDSGRAAP
jgi:hypothetical protein